jgi:hypothetical protein
MNYFPLPALEENLHLIREWESLALRMQCSNASGFSADISPEELIGIYQVEKALHQVEEAGRNIASEDETVRRNAVEEILQIYNSTKNGLRQEIRCHAAELARNWDGGSEPFAFSARIMLAAATTIVSAARQANDSATLKEVEASVEAAASGMAKSQRGDAEALSLVLLHELSSWRDGLSTQ